MGCARRGWIAPAAVLGGVLMLGAVGLVPTAGADAPNAQVVEVRDQDGDSVGVVKLLQKGDTVDVRADLRDLPPGFHGFHVHAVGECVPPFTSAGGHYNPGGGVHGDHAGDMPVLLVNEDGTAQARFTTDRFTVRDLVDTDGSAVIVHEAPDNFANIPNRYHSHTEDVFGPDSVTLAVGDAGGRLACGIIE
jgi:Cu-Zn family superoxide dismutase